MSVDFMYLQIVIDIQFPYEYNPISKIHCGYILESSIFTDNKTKSDLNTMKNIV